MKSKNDRLRAWCHREFPDLQTEMEKFLETVGDEDDFASVITRFRRAHLPDLTYSKDKFCKVKYN